ncbi:MAG: T9SS type A sorting domain-containing protein, partial [Flavobacteriales bacterium]|nr:T9SS type A sorting domain-containing protein [Flavobacteriales bacterium]
NGQIVTTLAGTDVTVTIDTSGVYIDGAQVTVADLVADNGVVHVIDAVLLPIFGCMDPTALNYDSTANIDDGNCLFPDCNGIAYGTSLLDDCGVCQQAYVFNLFTQNLVQYVLDTTGLVLGSTEVLVMPNDLSNSLTLWNSNCSGCTDPSALNYDSTATINDGSCNYGNANLFISEYAEGSTGTTNRYFEIFNPTSDTIDLFDYAWARVNGNPTTAGVYETWHDFNPGAVILPNDVYVVAHTNANAFIQNEADMISTALSNGDDGMALIYGVEPLTPTHPDSGLYQVLDWIGDWNGDPGQGWDVAGEVAATSDHTLVRKCDVVMGDTSWTNAAGTDPINSQWVVLNVNTWDFLGSHSNSPVYSSYFDTICNGLSITVNGNIYNSSGAYIDTLVSLFGCDSIVTTNLYVLPVSASFLNISATICDGDSVYVGSSIYFETGVYTDVLTNSVGCDSIITTDLTVQTPTYLYYNLCAGDSVVVGSNVYSSAGVYVDSLLSSIGCDSLVITEVSVYSQFNSIFGGILDNTVGGGGYYTGDQHLILDAYSPTNIVSATVYSDGNSIYEFELRDNNGNTLADTIYALNDGANFVTLNFEIPVGTDFELGVSAASGFEGLWRNNSGVSFPYDFGNLASITQSSAQQFGDYYYFFYNLEMKASSAPAEYSICQGDSIVIGSSIYTTSGSYVDTMISVSGCDSLVLTNLTVNPIVVYQNNQTVCLGETYTLGNNTYSVTGTYIDSFQTSFGCDSLVYTNLIVNQISGGSSTNNTTICSGDFFMVGSNMYTNSGTYIDVLTATNGCDSTVTTNLTVLSANYPTIFGGIPDSVVSPGGYFNFERRLVFDCYVPSTIVSALIFVEDAGTVTFELRDDNGTIIESSTQNVVPGPQRVTLNFSMPVGTDYELGLDNPNQIGIFRSNSNVNYPYNFGSLASITGSTANAAGYYYFYYDIELSANVTPNVVSLCDGNSVTVGSNTYSTSGIYYDTLNASNFCDSIVYTDLTVSQPFVPSISTNPFDGKICIGDNALITASTGFASYSWDNGMSGQIITVSPTTDQLYTLTTVDVNGCSAVNSVMIYVDSCNTDISELSSRFSVYPNPSSGIVNIEFKNSDNSFNQISIMNVLGEEIFILNEISHGENFKTLDFATYAKGVYLIKIKTDVGEINRKLIIE